MKKRNVIGRIDFFISLDYEHNNIFSKYIDMYYMVDTTRFLEKQKFFQNIKN